MAKRRLTRRQAWRIDKVQQERRERLQRKTSAAEARLKDAQLGAEQEGLVIANHGANLKLEGLARGRPDGVVHHAVPRANLALPVAGDRVVWRATRDGQAVVIALLERGSELGRPGADGSNRPLAANIDRILVVAATRPPLHEDLIDRYLVAAELLDIRPLLVINKADLLSSDQAVALRKRLQV